MSEYKKEAKAASAAKMQRMGLKLEDGSQSFTDERGGSPFEGLNSGNAGKMPITPSRFKRGGKVAHVAGEKAHKNLGKAPRKAAGGSSNVPLPPPRPKNMDKVPLPPTRSIDDEYKAYHPDDDKYLGSNTTGYARGGQIGRKQAAAIAYKKKGSGMSGKMALPKMSGMPNLASDNYIPRKSGGAAKHTDEAQDKKLMHKILKPKAFKADGGSTGRRRYDKLDELDQMFKPLRDYKQAAQIRDTLRKQAVNGVFGPKEQKLEKNRLENESLTSSGLKHGGRAHKLSGGAMSRYLAEAGPSLSGISKAKGSAESMRSSVGARTGRPQAETDVERDFTRKMGNRMQGIERAGRLMNRKLQDSNENLENTKYELGRTSDEMRGSGGMKKGGRAMHHADCSCKMCSGGMAERSHRATGGRTKGKTNVNIIISPQSGGQGQGVLGAGVGMGQPPVPPMMPPVPPQMPPMPPAGGMPMGGAPQLPPQLMAALAARGGAGGPPMPRKTGGRVGNVMPKYQEKDYGSGSGLGRLVKKKWPTANGTE